MKHLQSKRKLISFTYSPSYLGLYLYRQFVAAVYLRPAGEAGADVVGSVFVAFGDEVVLVP